MCVGSVDDVQFTPRKRSSRWAVRCILSVGLHPLGKIALAWRKRVDIASANDMVLRTVTRVAGESYGGEAEGEKRLPHLGLLRMGWIAES